MAKGKKQFDRTSLAYETLSTDDQKKEFRIQRRALERRFLGDIVPRVKEYYEHVKAPGEMPAMLMDMRWDIQQDSQGLGLVPASAQKGVSEMMTEAGIVNRYYGPEIESPGKKDVKPFFAAKSFLEFDMEGVTDEVLIKFAVALDRQNAKLAGFASRNEYLGAKLAEQMDDVLGNENPADKIAIFETAVKRSTELPAHVKGIKGSHANNVGPKK